MVDRYQRQVDSIGDRLGGVGADEERSCQAGAGGHRHRVDTLQGTTGALQRLLQDGHDRLHMLARGELRHHATVASVELHLRGDDAGQNLPPIADDGGGRLVAGSLNAEDVQATVSGRAAIRRAAQLGISFPLW